MSRKWPRRRVPPSQAGPRREDLIWHQPGRFHLNNRHADPRGVQRGGLPPHCQRGNVIPPPRQCGAAVMLSGSVKSTGPFLQMGITSRDHSTPVVLVKNLSQHLSGTARTIGAALIGRFGKSTGLGGIFFLLFFFFLRSFNKHFLHRRGSRFHPQKSVHCLPVCRRPCGGSQYGCDGAGRQLSVRRREGSRFGPGDQLCHAAGNETHWWIQGASSGWVWYPRVPPRFSFKSEKS